MDVMKLNNLFTMYMDEELVGSFETVDTKVKSFYKRGGDNQDIEQFWERAIVNLENIKAHYPTIENFILRVYEREEDGDIVLRISCVGDEHTSICNITIGKDGAHACGVYCDQFGGNFVDLVTEAQRSQHKEVLFLKDHTNCPGGRLKQHGAYSGEWFREDILVPTINNLIQSKKDWTLKVDCLGTYGLPASWLDEVTYRLKDHFSDDILERVTFVLPKGHACDNASSCRVIEL